MRLPDRLRGWFIDFAFTDAFQQTVPLLVLILIPTIVYLLITNPLVASSFNDLSMGLYLYLPWNWAAGGTSPSNESTRSSDRKKSKSRKSVRTRTEQIALNGVSSHSSQNNTDDGYYPGLVNISGTYCFMNSTLQALASLSYLQPHINTIHVKAEALDVPTPVIDALQELFRRLNTPKGTYHSIRPIELIEVLGRQAEGGPSSLLNSREHQDAQEFFQLLSECIKNEIAAVDKEGYRDRGLGGLSQASETTKEIGKDCICRKCSLVATHKRLIDEVQILEEATRPEANPSASKKKRLRDVRKMQRRVHAALEEGRIEDNLPDVRIERVMSKASTKQAMIARPPQVLALHINRSVHYGQYVAKNAARVIFPEVLDLTPYTTSGSLSTIPTSAISTPPPPIRRSTTPTPANFAHPRTLYRLSAVVCHYGQHSYGHYICYRRRPRNSNLPPHKRWAPPRLVDPLHSADTDAAETEASQPYIWETEDGHREPPARRGHGWLRISDNSVEECGVESVLAEGAGAFMLYYERVVLVQPAGGVMYASGGGGNVSEETLRPELRTVDLNGSAGSLVTEVGIGVREGRAAVAAVAANGSAAVPEPRIVRSVAAGRKRSSSVVSSDRELSALPNGKTAATEDTTAPSPKKTLPSLIVPPQATPSPKHIKSRTLSPASHSPLPGPSPVVGLKA
ncbi:Ubiquitin carboxyl-terminal hydrolase 16 [Termitomyces sp. J132]|nr:Ubiquitin carboxyl-terminal hydrolase 16 [Termitomyces sp. J132]